jgi:hypothetical protein
LGLVFPTQSGFDNVSKHDDKIRHCALRVGDSCVGCNGAGSGVEKVLKKEVFKRPNTHTQRSRDVPLRMWYKASDVAFLICANFEAWALV